MLSNTVAVMSDVTCIRVNESMSLHVHVEAKEENFSLANQWEKYLPAIPTLQNIVNSFLLFLYNWQTAGSESEKCHSYFESNLIALIERHDNPLNAIFSCQTQKDLYELMNPNIFRQRYHKLNLKILQQVDSPRLSSDSTIPPKMRWKSWHGFDFALCLSQVQQGCHPLTTYHRLTTLLNMKVPRSIICLTQSSRSAQLCTRVLLKKENGLWLWSGTCMLQWIFTPE